MSDFDWRQRTTNPNGESVKNDMYAHLAQRLSVVDAVKCDLTAS